MRTARIALAGLALMTGIVSAAGIASAEDDLSPTPYFIREPLVKPVPLSGEEKKAASRAARLAREARGGLPDAASRHLRALVAMEARAAGVPVELAKAVVMVESTWRAHVTGAAGEVGLMQIKEPTAEMVGFEGRRPELYRPENNIRYGVRYLAGAWKKAKGDLCFTVSKYNGGHGVKRTTSTGRVYCDKVLAVMEKLPWASRQLIAGVAHPEPATATAPVPPPIDYAAAAEEHEKVRLAAAATF